MPRLLKRKNTEMDTEMDTEIIIDDENDDDEEYESKLNVILVSPPSPPQIPHKNSPTFKTKDQLLSPTEIKGKISPLYFREESKGYYQQQMLIASERKLKSGKHSGKKYCDVLKIDPKYIMYLLKCDYVKPDELRDYLILSMPSFYFYA